MNLWELFGTFAYFICCCFSELGLAKGKNPLWNVLSLLCKEMLQNLCNTTLLAFPTKARILCLDSL
jgi:hypothetical protein